MCWSVMPFPVPVGLTTFWRLSQRLKRLLRSGERLSKRLCRNEDSGDSRSGECLGETGEHCEVGMKLDTLQATEPERRQPVVVLQAAELTLDGGKGQGGAASTRRSHEESGWAGFV